MTKNTSGPRNRPRVWAALIAVAVSLVAPAAAPAYYDGAGAQPPGIELPSAKKVAQHRGVPATRLADPLPTATAAAATSTANDGGDTSMLVRIGAAVLVAVALGAVVARVRLESRRTAQSGA